MERWACGKCGVKAVHGQVVKSSTWPSLANLDGPWLTLDRHWPAQHCEVIRTSLREFFIKMIRIIVVKIMMMKTICQWRLWSWVRHWRFAHRWREFALSTLFHLFPLPLIFRLRWGSCKVTFIASMISLVFNLCLTSSLQNLQAKILYVLDIIYSSPRYALWLLNHKQRGWKKI